MAIFNNESILYMYDSYLRKRDKSFVLPSNPFDVVMKTLITIYGEANIINPFYTKSDETLVSNLKAYGATNVQLEFLFQDIDNLYKWYISSDNTKTIMLSKVENDLIDLIFLKEKEANNTNLNKYINLLYVEENPNPNYKLYNNLSSKDPKNTSRYLKRKINNPLLFEEIKEMLLSDALYQNYGLSLEEVKKLSNSDIRRINDKIISELNSNNESGGRTKSTDGRQLILANGKGFVSPLVLSVIVVLLLALIAIMIYLLFRR